MELPEVKTLLTDIKNILNESEEFGDVCLEVQDYDDSFILVSIDTYLFIEVKKATVRTINPNRPVHSLEYTPGCYKIVRSMSGWEPDDVVDESLGEFNNLVGACAELIKFMFMERIQHILEMKHTRQRIREEIDSPSIFDNEVAL